MKIVRMIFYSQNIVEKLRGSSKMIVNNKVPHTALSILKKKEVGMRLLKKTWMGW